MNRAEKQAFVDSLAKNIKEAQAFAFLSFTKLTVEQMTSFRLSLRKRKVNVKVIKNTLAKRVLDDSEYKEAGQHIDGPTLIAYGSEDPVATAKAIWEWADKEDFSVKVKGGVALGQLMSMNQLKALSRLPGRNELFVSFLWALKGKPTQLLYCVQDIPRRAGYALGALKAKKEQEAKA